MRLNVPIVGFIIGLLLPLLGMFVMYLIWDGHSGVAQFVHTLTSQKNMAGKVVLLGVLANLIPFVYFNLKRLDYALRGVFIATMLWAMFDVLVRYVW
jgi:hypothetical protein